MKNTMNYEAPVAEMIELQASMVLMNSGEGTAPSQITGNTGNDTGEEY
jgi:hypothetical protein